MRKKRMGKAFAMLVSAVLTASMVVTPVFAASENATKKDETVYVKMDASGNQESVTVSDYLKNAKKASKITDKTDLTKVENVKGDETYKTGASNAITWNANGNDIYYQGKTDKELPVGMSVTYYLDGKQITPDKIVGKSGKVEIKYEFTNNNPKTVKIDGKDTTLYTPFVVVTGAILPTEHFSNVKIDNGKVISDGTKHIVIGITFPGLNQSLNLNDTSLNVDMPESFTVTADAKDFELNVTASVASADMLSDLGLNNDDADISDLQDSLNKLKDSSKQLVDGSGKLLKGVQTLQSSTKEFNSGIKKVDKNMKKLSKGLNTLNAKKGQLVTGANKVAAGSSKLSTGTQKLETATKDLPTSSKELNDGATEILTKVKEMKTKMADTSKQDAVNREITDDMTVLGTQIATIQSEIGELEAIKNTTTDDATKTALETTISNLSTRKDNLQAAFDDTKKEFGKLKTILTETQQTLGTGVDDLITGLTTLQGGTAKLAGSSTTLANGIKDANAGAKELTSGSKQVASGAKALGDGINTAASGGKKLSEGTGQLSVAGDKLQKGVGTLVSGTKTLNDGMIKFDQEGIQKLLDIFNNNAKDVLDRADKLVDLGDEYQTFTQKAGNTSGSVKFMMETEEIQ